MNTCPNCGSIVMEGDPYCPHCGVHLKWDSDDEFEFGRNGGSISEINYDGDALFLGYGETSQTFHDSDEATLEYIAEGVCETHPQKMQLKAKLREYVAAEDFNGFYIKKDYGFDVYYFNFIQENEFVRTTHKMTYFPDEYHISPERAFYETYSEHNHDKLLANPRFKDLIKGVGLEFTGCGGGYMLYLKHTYLDVELTGEIEIDVYFKVNNKKKRQYELDLESMQLSDEYDEYDIEEYCYEW